jgi:hypothetical protein
LHETFKLMFIWIDSFKKSITSKNSQVFQKNGETTHRMVDNVVTIEQQCSTWATVIYRYKRGEVPCDMWMLLGTL